MQLIIINGPNLNLLGKREPEIYGNTSFKESLEQLKQKFPMADISYFQSNIEGEIIDKLHEVGFNYDGVILNAGAYTHPEHQAISQSLKCIFLMFMPEKILGIIRIWQNIVGEQLPVSD